MSDDLTPEQKFAADDAEELVPRALLLGRTPDEVVADLVSLDWSPRAARSLVSRFVTEMQAFQESAAARRTLIDRARNQFIVGLLLAVVGVGQAVVFFLAAAGGVGVFWAIPFFCFFGGCVSSGRGWSRWRLYRQWSRLLDEARR